MPHFPGAVACGRAMCLLIRAIFMLFWFSFPRYTIFMAWNSGCSNQGRSFHAEVSIRPLSRLALTYLPIVLLVPDL
jgi:hypothetical protein